MFLSSKARSPVRSALEYIIGNKYVQIPFLVEVGFGCGVTRRMAWTEKACRFAPGVKNIFDVFCLQICFRLGNMFHTHV